MFHACSPEEVDEGREDTSIGSRRKVVPAIRDAVRDALATAPAGSLLLAVSGGADSLVLFDAVQTVAPERVAAVAVFDHGSGAHGRRAVEVVSTLAVERGVRVVSGQSPADATARATEAQWRAARWAFLRDAQQQVGAAAVATGHTWDDQVETVCMRLLRGAGARGLAGLAASTGVVRPLLGVRRSQTQAYARDQGLPVVEDPTNASRTALRNRVRLDLLPAFERVQPGFADALWALGARAADWREATEAWVATVPLTALGPASWAVPIDAVPDHAPVRPHWWAALLARVGVVLDRRGTERLARFTTTGVSGREIQLAGGVAVRRAAGAFVVTRSKPGASGVRPIDDGEP